MGWRGVGREAWAGVSFRPLLLLLLTCRSSSSADRKYLSTPIMLLTAKDGTSGTPATARGAGARHWGWCVCACVAVSPAGRVARRDTEQQQQQCCRAARGGCGPPRDSAAERRENARVPMPLLCLFLDAVAAPAHRRRPSCTRATRARPHTPTLQSTRSRRRVDRTRDPHARTTRARDTAEPPTHISSLGPPPRAASPHHSPSFAH